MKCSKSVVRRIVSVLFARYLYSAIVLGHSMPAMPLVTLAAAQTAKHQCMNTCRARYRDCRSSEPVTIVRGVGDVYQDLHPIRFATGFRTRMTDVAF